MKKQPIKISGQKPVIELVDLVKQYGDKVVLQELNMSINKGEFITLLGASGSGKTTALRLIGGFEFPTRGEIRFNGIDVKDLPAHKRPTNTVFQDYALFPHLTVEGNVKYGLKLFRVPKNEKRISDEQIKFWKQKVKIKINKLTSKNKIKKWENFVEKKIKNENIKNKKFNKKFNANKIYNLNKLEILKNKWKQKASLEKIKLLKKQDFEINILDKAKKVKQQNNINKFWINIKNDLSSKIAQKFIDSLDFKISFWDNYVDQKIELFQWKYMKRPLTKNELNKKVMEMIEMVGLTGNEKKSIDQISGGMRQRVALARSIILEPEVLLLDEPLSALDAKIRQKMQHDLRKIQRKLGMTFIFVTHDQEEAMVMSDRVAVMREGRLEQFGTPKQLYDYPINAWVASFIGDSTLFKGIYVKKGVVNFLGKDFKCEPYNILIGSKVDVMLRPEDLEISSKKKGFIKGRVINRTFKGAMWDYRIILEEDKKIKIIVETSKNYEPESIVNISWNYLDIHVMSEEEKNGKNK